MTRIEKMEQYLRSLKRRTIMVASPALSARLVSLSTEKSILVPLGFCTPEALLDELLGMPSFASIVMYASEANLTLADAKKRLEAARFTRFSASLATEELRTLDARYTLCDDATRGAQAFYASVDVTLAEVEDERVSWALEAIGIPYQVISFLQDEETRADLVVARSRDEEIIGCAEAIASLVSSGIPTEDITVQVLDPTELRSAQEIFSFYGFKLPGRACSLYAYPLSRAFLDELSEMIDTPLEDAITMALSKALALSPHSPAEAGVLSLASSWLASGISMFSSVHYRLIEEELKDEAGPLPKGSFATGESDYLFMIGASSQVYPHPFQDDDILRDKVKELVGLPTSTVLSSQALMRETKKLSHHPFVRVSYVRTNDADPLSLVFSRLGISPREEGPFTSAHSRALAGLVYAKEREIAVRYGSPSALHDALEVLFSAELKVPYEAKYSGVDQDVLRKKLKDFRLSYSSIEDYYECPFKFYLNYILRIDPFTSNALTTLGDICHEVLEKTLSARQDGVLLVEKEEAFIEEAFARAAEKADEELEKKDSFITFYRAEALNYLKTLIPMIEEWESRTAFTKGKFEESFNCHDFILPLTGKIDKLLTAKIAGKLYAIVIDYKTGESAKTDIRKIPYGLNMQLFVYFYLLLHASSTPCEFAGAYLEHIFPSNPFIAKMEGVPKTKEEQLRAFVRLDGYTTSDLAVVEAIDPEKSFLKGISINKSNGMASKTSEKRMLDKQGFKEALAICQKKIADAARAISGGLFDIRPAWLEPLEKKDLACQNCPHKDICHVRVRIGADAEEGDEHGA